MKRSTHILSVVCLALMTLLFASPVDAATYYVATTGNDANPGTQAQPFRTIGKGVAAAVNNDTVQVASGTYYEVISWNSKKLFLKGAGASQSIIDGSRAAQCLRMDRASSTLVDGFTFRNGYDEFLGGAGMYIASSNPVVMNCIFENNKGSFVHGGGISVRGGSLTVVNCVFKSNIAQSARGGAIYNYQGNLTVTNCTFVNNSANSGGTAISTVGGTSAITNCIVRGDAFSPIDTFIGTSTVNNSNVEGGFTGSGNINADPQFTNGYHLQSTSPCINTGSAAAPSLPAADFDGLPRIMGSSPDMGVYELWSSASGVWFVDKTLGSDTTGNGSPTAPYKTVTKAYTVAANGHKLYIKAGNYGTDKIPTLPRMTKSLRLFNWLDTGQSSIGKP